MYINLFFGAVFHYLDEKRSCLLFRVDQQIPAIVYATKYSTIFKSGTPTELFDAFQGSLAVISFLCTNNAAKPLFLKNSNCLLSLLPTLVLFITSWSSISALRLNTPNCSSVTFNAQKKHIHKEETEPLFSWRLCFWFGIKCCWLRYLTTQILRNGGSYVKDNAGYR